MDVLAEVLAAAGVRGSVAATVHAGEPWGFALEDVPGAAFHAITAGTAWLRVRHQAPVRLMPGDLILLPTGAAHALSSEPSGPLVAFDHAAAQHAAGSPVLVGTAPAQTRILCASYRHDPAVTTPVLSLLPEMVHIPGTTASAGLGDTLRLLATELAGPQIGSSTILDRLVDVLLIMVVRSWLASSSHDPPVSWLGALHDTVISTALAALHSEPARDWTVTSLASHVAVSRATFARRFVATVGETPGAHLTRWRMDLAARRLRDTDESIASIASAVGYSSEFAFSRAFARARSIPPTKFRVQARRELTAALSD